LEESSSSQEISELFPAQGMQRRAPHHRKSENYFRHRKCRGELLITGNQRIISGTENAEESSSSQEISKRFPAQGMQRGTPHHRK
jgi:hypothetical protein